jgi:DNA-binding NarL/FixJ family response regulator
MNSRREKVRLLLVDDDPAVLKRASEFLSTEFEIAGFASDGAEALDAIERLVPDVIVLDIAMPVLDGIQTACRLRSDGNEVSIIFLSATQDPFYVKAAMNLGGNGYVFKSRLGLDLVPAVREVISGGTFVSGQLRNPIRGPKYA